MESDSQLISFITIISHKCRQRMLWFNFCTVSGLMQTWDITPSVKISNF